MLINILKNHFRFSFLLKNKKAIQFNQYKYNLSFISKIRESLLYQLGFLRSSTNIFLLSNVFIVNYDYVVYYTLLVFILCCYFICLLIVNNHESVEETINNEISLSLQLKEVFKFVTLFFKVIKQYVYILFYNFNIFYFRIKNKKNIVLRQDAGLVFLGLIAIYLGTYIYEYMFLSDIEVFIKNFDESYKLYCLANGIEYDSFRQNTQYAYWRMSHKAQTYSIWTIRSILIGFGSYMVFTIVKAKFDGDPKDPKSSDNDSFVPPKSIYTSNTSSEHQVGVLQQSNLQIDLENIDVIKKGVEVVQEGVDVMKPANLNMSSKILSSLMTETTPGALSQFIVANMSVTNQPKLSLSEFNDLLAKFSTFLDKNVLLSKTAKRLTELRSELKALEVRINKMRGTEQEKNVMLKEYNNMADLFNFINNKRYEPLIVEIKNDLNSFNVLLDKSKIPGSGRELLVTSNDNKEVIMTQIFKYSNTFSTNIPIVRNNLIDVTIRIQLVKQSEQGIFKLSDKKNEICNKFKWDLLTKELEQRGVSADVDDLKSRMRSINFWKEERIALDRLSHFLVEQDRLLKGLRDYELNEKNFRSMFDKIMYQSGAHYNEENNSLDLSTLTSEEFLALLKTISDNFF